VVVALFLLVVLGTASLADARSQSDGVTITVESPTNVTPTTASLVGRFDLSCSSNLETAYFIFHWDSIVHAGAAGTDPNAGSGTTHWDPGINTWTTQSYAVPNLRPGDTVKYHLAASYCGDYEESSERSLTLPATATFSVTGGGGTVNGPNLNCATTCTIWWGEGDPVTVTATPSPGYRFSSWDGACAGQPAACTATVIGVITAHATFAPTHALTVTRSGDGSGTVTSAPAGISCGATCSAGFDVGASVTLTEAPGAGSSFQGWSGACSGTATTCTVAMSDERAVTAQFDKDRSLSLSIKGHGTIASTPAGLDCPSACQAAFPRHAVVQLTATPAAGWAFFAWNGACSGTSCSVTLDEDAHVGAEFRPYVVLTVARTGKGSGTVTSSSGISCGKRCSAKVVAGTTVTLRAKASKHSRFDHWSGACASFKAKPACTLKLSRAAGVVAAFAAA
jgi:hypothetical protein